MENELPQASPTNTDIVTHFRKFHIVSHIFIYFLIINGRKRQSHYRCYWVIGVKYEGRSENNA